VQVGVPSVHPESARMPRVIGPGLWIDSAVPIAWVISEFTLPAGNVASSRWAMLEPLSQERGAYSLGLTPELAATP
jgi:hypothetical protein